MIDWVTAIIPFIHEPVNSGSVMKITPDGQVEWESPCRVMVEGSHDQNIYIRSQGGSGAGRATELRIEGNPAKYLQGHNIFGSDDLQLLTFDTFMAVCRVLGIPVSPDEANEVWQGNYRLTRIDINYMYEVGTSADVRLWLRAAEYKSKARQGRPSSKGGTLYWHKTSRRWTIKAYSKEEEINGPKGHKLPKKFGNTPLKEFTQGKLRIELTLRGKELDELNLSQASKWRGETPLQQFSDYIKRIQMNEQIALSTKEINELPTYLRSTYILWKDGYSPREAMSKPTFYKHRKHLLDYGINIDLAVEKEDRSNVVPLIRVLEATPVAIPDWAYDLGLIHGSASNG